MRGYQTFLNKNEVSATNSVQQQEEDVDEEFNSTFNRLEETSEKLLEFFFIFSITTIALEKFDLLMKF